MSDVCLWCGTPIAPSKRKHIERKFCRDAHRAAWRNAERTRAIARALAVLEHADRALDSLRAEIRQQQDVLRGLLPEAERGTVDTVGF